MKPKKMTPHSLTILAGLIVSSLACIGQTVNIPASWSYPSSSADTTKPGFSGKIRQARQDAILSATIGRGNDHLNDLLLDPLALVAYENTAVDVTNVDVINQNWPGSLAVQTDGSFVVPDVLNFSATAGGDALSPEDGSFTFGSGFPDKTFPGFPGESTEGSLSYTNGLNMSAEFLAFIELPAGQTTLTMRNDDASQLAIHPNDARDIFRTGIIESTSNNPNIDRSVTVDVAQAGLYSIRAMVAQWTGSASLELSSGIAPSRNLVNAPSDLGSTTPPSVQISNANGSVTLTWAPPEGVLEESPDLVTPFEQSANQDNPQSRTASGKGFFRVRAAGSSSGGLRAWRSLTTTVRPYVTAVSPQASQSGVVLNSNIVVTMQNRNGTLPVMRVGGTPVTYTIVDNGSESTLTYDPPSTFTSGQQVTMELDYGNATASWNFTAATGNKAILITSGLTADSGLKARLANDFGLDVKVYLDTANSGAALETLVADATDAKLIWHSSNVGGVNAAPIASRLRDLAVPIICVEAANVDEYRMSGSTVAVNVPTSQPNVNIVILNSGHPTAAGLAPGTYPLVTSSEQAHSSVPYPEVTRVAEAPPFGTSTLCTLSAVESGVTVNQAGPAPFLHKNRRVFFGAVGNEGSGKLASPNGVSIFNSVVNWALAGVATP